MLFSFKSFLEKIKSLYKIVFLFSQTFAQDKFIILTYKYSSVEMRMQAFNKMAFLRKTLEFAKLFFAEVL